jgi:predicted RNA-binding Zn-ribbon protein involved in translation (DUF1610 family)
MNAKREIKSSGWEAKSQLWTRMYHFYNFDREEFLQHSLRDGLRGLTGLRSRHVSRLYFWADLGIRFHPMAGYKYLWKCPSCGTELQLRMRVTQTKRKCPHCGVLVTPQEIDRQTLERQRSFETTFIWVCLGLMLLMYLCQSGRLK